MGLGHWPANPCAHRERRAKGFGERGMTREIEPIRIEITEDSSAGMRVRLHNNGRFPDVLSGIPRQVIRKARPWLWNSYERRVMKAAQMMSWQSRRLVRNLLIAERARVLVEKSQQPQRVGWLARRRAEARQREATRQRLEGLLPTNHRTVSVQDKRQGPAALPQPSKRAERTTATSPEVMDRWASTTPLAVASPSERSMIEDMLAETRYVPDRPQPLSERSMIDDILAEAQAVPERPHLASEPEQGRLLERDPDTRPQGALLAAKPAPELSLVERMLAGTALDSVRAMPNDLSRASQPYRSDTSDRSR